MKKEHLVYGLIGLGAGLCLYALGEYIYQLQLVQRWQAEGKAAFAAWKTSVWQDWWDWNSWELAAACWADTANTVISFVGGLISIFSSLVLRGRQQ